MVGRIMSLLIVGTLMIGMIGMIGKGAQNEFRMLIDVVGLP